MKVRDLITELQRLNLPDEDVIVRVRKPGYHERSGAVDRVRFEPTHVRDDAGKYVEPRAVILEVTR